MVTNSFDAEKGKQSHKKSFNFSNRVKKKMDLKLWEKYDYRKSFSKGHQNAKELKQHKKGL